MITVRWGTFETNSSSVHSMVIATDKELRQFKAGKLFVDRLPEFSDDNTDSTAELIDMDEVYRRYQDADEESYVLPKISKLTHYYKMKNIQADTEMRENIAKQ